MGRRIDQLLAEKDECSRNVHSWLLVRLLRARKVRFGQLVHGIATVCPKDVQCCCEVRTAD